MNEPTYKPIRMTVSLSGILQRFGEELRDAWAPFKELADQADGNGMFGGEYVDEKPALTIGELREVLGYGEWHMLVQLYDHLKTVRQFMEAGRAEEGVRAFFDLYRVHPYEEVPEAPHMELLNVLRVADRDDVLQHCFGVEPDGTTSVEQALAAWREAGYPGTKPEPKQVEGEEEASDAG